MNDENKGFIMLHRKMLNWEWWTDLATFRLFVTVILLANWKDKRWRGRVIPRGSCWTSIAQLAEKSCLTISQTRTALKKLNATGEITSETTSLGTLISVVNYDVYQLGADKIANELTSDSANELANELASDLATTKNINNINNNNNIKQQRGGDIDINELLTVDEVIKLSKKYRNLDTLLAEVEADIRAKEKQIRYPFRYVDGYARNKGWPRKEG